MHWEREIKRTYSGVVLETGFPPKNYSMRYRDKIPFLMSGGQMPLTEEGKLAHSPFRNKLFISTVKR